MFYFYVNFRNYRAVDIPEGSTIYNDINTAMLHTIKKHRGNKGGIFKSYKISKVGKRSPLIFFQILSFYPFYFNSCGVSSNIVASSRLVY